MFTAGIISLRQEWYQPQIWAEACGGTEQAVARYALLYDVTIHSKLRPKGGVMEIRAIFLRCFYGARLLTDRFLCDTIRYPVPSACCLFGVPMAYTGSL